MKIIAKATIAELSYEPTLLGAFAKFCVQMFSHYTGTGLQPIYGLGMGVHVLMFELSRSYSTPRSG